MKTEIKYVSFVREKAEKGDAQAQKALGDIYYFAIGWDKSELDVDNRFGQAFMWYRKAAEQESAEEQYALGSAYYFGNEGVDKNTKTAAMWYRKAAKNGYAEAQYALGRMYYFGEGSMDENKKLASEWYQKAREQGHSDAAYRLAQMYLKGDGIQKDLRESYRCGLDAADMRHQPARRLMQEVRWRDYLSLSDMQDIHEILLYPPPLDECIDDTVDSDVVDKKQESELDRIRKMIHVVNSLEQEYNAKHIFNAVWRSVVEIHTSRSTGSGVIIQPNIVATNWHVVEDAHVNDIDVFKARDKKANDTVPYRVIKSQPHKYHKQGADFCLLYVDNLHGVPATIRDYDSLEIGEAVYALGTPKGHPLTFSSGIVSQKRAGICTDAAMSPGSSGGGLFDSAGNLIGLTTESHAKSDAQNLNFAMPADLVLDPDFE